MALISDIIDLYSVCHNKAMDICPSSFMFISRKHEIAVLITTGNGKFFSNGFDLNYLSKLVHSNLGAANVFIQKFTTLVSRILTFPMITIASINGESTHGVNPLHFGAFIFCVVLAVRYSVWCLIFLVGHAYAGGAVFSLAHDYQLMSSHRGWWCINKVHLGIRFDFIDALTR